MDHFLSPRNQGRLEAPSCIGHVGQVGAGPFMIIYLRLREGRILEARFQSHGCGPTIACGSMLTEMVLGRSPEECRAITVERLSDALGGVPPDKAHSAVLAITALRDALESRVVPSGP